MTYIDVWNKIVAKARRAYSEGKTIPLQKVFDEVMIDEFATQAPPAHVNGVVQAWTDGGCSSGANVGVGPGGYGFVVRWPDGQEFADKGGALDTTAQRMEVSAVLNALQFIDAQADGRQKIRVYCDSKYAANTVNNWLSKWRNNGWKLSSGKAPAHLDLWMRIHELMIAHEVEAVWIPREENSRADALVGKAIKRLMEG